MSFKANTSNKAETTAAAAAFASMILKGYKSNDDVIDKSRVWRAWKNLQQERIDSIPALYFDGRKNLKIITKGGEPYQLSVIDEYILILKKPGLIYISYAVPIQRTAKVIKSVIHESMRRQDILFEANILAIDCDGTVTMADLYGY